MIKIGMGLGSTYFSLKRQGTGGTVPPTSYPILLGYDTADPDYSCVISRSTYYSNTNILTLGSFLFLNAEKSIPAPEGYYSNGTNVYPVNNMGEVTSEFSDFCIY